MRNQFFTIPMQSIAKPFFSMLIALTILFAAGIILGDTLAKPWQFETEECINDILEDKELARFDYSHPKTTEPGYLKAFVFAAYEEPYRSLLGVPPELDFRI